MTATENTHKAATLPVRLREGLALSRLPALDGIRAVAVALVVLYHVASERIPGGLGVLIFFVISGFLITWLLLEEQDRFETISVGRFYLRRTLRIFPAFYVYWCLAAAIGMYTQRIIWSQAIASFFYVNNYYQAFNGHLSSGFSHTWSLGVEEQFYLLWPAAFLLLAKVARKTAARLLLAAIIVIWIYRWFLLFVIGVKEVYIYEAFDTRADHLLIGCLLAFSLRTGLFSSIWSRLCGSVAYSLAIVAALLFSVLSADYFGFIYRNAVGFVIDPVLVALLIPATIGFRAHIAWAWLNWPPIRFLGTISYSIYLYHGFGALLGRKFAANTIPFLLVPAQIVGVIGIASASYYGVEQRFLRFKTKFVRTKVPDAGNQSATLVLK